MEPVLIEKESGWTRIVLNRPDKLNSFDGAMHAALAAALDRVAEDRDCRAVVLTGAGRGFCAGQDLALRQVEKGGEAPDLGQTVDTLWNPLVRRIRSLPKPVVCAVNGVAAGAGANLALSCDIVVAARSAKFIQAFSSIGLVPDSGGTFFLPRLVGDARARAVAMLAVPIAAEHAEAWGMIWKAVDDDALAGEAARLAQDLAARSARGLALIKQALNASRDNSLDDQLDLERDLQRIAGRTSEYAESVSAFLEKRTPPFKK
ncbi:MAG: 2-(1,2-epoxy-1,2-dihydrophenyl)acetyl-CoA isomerase PaaG [Beijerinckiaceae bacterium]|nr:2-(1,2-epoxy-1,2-dihydrophenyl)acetyl-CoA isomerase PaaG [Beijerinckiaceae bacterium]